MIDEDGLSEWCAANGLHPSIGKLAIWQAAIAHEYKRFEPLQDAVEDIINNGHMNTELLARLRAAFEDVVTGGDAIRRGEQ